MKTSQTPPQCALNELKALRLAYGDAQRRCTEQLLQLHRRNQRLEAEVMRLRARLITQDTMAMWAREDQTGEWPGEKTSSRGMVSPASRVSLGALVQGLLRMLARGQVPQGDESGVPVASRQRRGAADMIPVNAASSSAVNDEQASIESAYGIPDLEKRLVEADLVICQTGCLSHDAYWRMQDHCRRLNKPCVLVAQPDALRIVRIHNRGEAVTTSETAGSDAV